MIYQHDWKPSKLGHGTTMCARCFVTDREAAALGELNSCIVPPKEETNKGDAQPASDEFKKICGWIFDPLYNTCLNIYVAKGIEHPPMHVILSSDGKDVIKSYRLPNSGPIEIKDIIANLHKEVADMGFISILIHERSEAITMTMARGKESMFVSCEIDRKTNTLNKGELIDAFDSVKGRYSRTPLDQ